MVKELVESRKEYISRLKAEAAQEVEAKYLDLALELIEEAQNLEKDMSKIAGIYRERKLKMALEIIENYKRANDLLIKAILTGESMEIALKKLEKAVSSRAPLRMKIIAALYGEKDPMTPSELAEKFGLAVPTVHEALQELLRLQLIEKDEKGRYKLRDQVMESIFRLLWSGVNELKARGEL
jgi:DNA-binding transcriptional ArsR family regulator